MEGGRGIVAAADCASDDDGDAMRGVSRGDMGRKPAPLKADVAIGDVVGVEDNSDGAVEATRDGEEAEDEDGVVGSPVCANVNLAAADLRGVTALSVSVLPPLSSSGPPPLLLLPLLLLASCIHAA